MERNRGSEGIKLVECINPRLQKYIVRWDVQPYVEEREEGVGETSGVSFVQHTFLHKPSFSEIKDVITAWMNSEIDKKIVSGFEWRGMLVWLSTENQFNYKAAYDLAMQSNGSFLPVVFKFGSTENPMYYEFITLEDLTDFYAKALNHVNTTLNNGWMEKDAFDWGKYEELLSE